MKASLTRLAASILLIVCATLHTGCAPLVGALPGVSYPTINLEQSELMPKEAALALLDRSFPGVNSDGLSVSGDNGSRIAKFEEINMLVLDLSMTLREDFGRGSVRAQVHHSYWYGGEEAKAKELMDWREIQTLANAFTVLGATLKGIHVYDPYSRLSDHANRAIEE